MFFKKVTSPIIFTSLFVVFLAVPVAAKKANHAMTSNSDCSKTALSKSECMIKLALEDIKNTYKHVGGGGITEIKSTASNTYTVSISQDERIDHITYEFNSKPSGGLSIFKRSEGSTTKGK